MGERLGQHMLVNKTAIPKIIAALDLQPNEQVIEIGPGEGALTFPLLEAAQKVGAKMIAIEKDHELVNKLKSLKVEKLELIEGDVLKVLPGLLASDIKHLTFNIKLIGNIPYYITGQLLRILSEAENPPKTSVLMVQREVAERICSKPPKMNLLSAITQFWAQPELILSLKPEDFDPPPKVNSSVIRLHSKSTNYQLLATSYYRLIRLVFKQPRKTAANNLADGLEISKREAVDLIKSVGLQENSRPQNFSLDQLIKLSTITAK
ncbi:MAG: 16S rRNA (adenine(1518)-N(6)/adenine(1519)-N(6))-dimethyltransferase RsmA [Patescibacteria group bacterium]